MNEERLKRAREVVALRDRAKRGPYRAWLDAEGRLIRSDVDDGNPRDSGFDDLAFLDCELDAASGLLWQC